jgi:D-sedoheptulose 7-phosphate isomerase
MKSQFDEQVRLINLVINDKVLLAKIEESVEWITDCLLMNYPVLICGNGGSASDALHFSGELVGRFVLERRSLNVICLNSNVTVMTAWANDYSYETVFARQVEAHGQVNGIFIGISTSGNSNSVQKGLLKAKQIGMKTIALTGKSGGSLQNCADLLINVPSTDTPRIQEIHLPIYHYICNKVESKIVQAEKEQQQG